MSSETPIRRRWLPRFSLRTLLVAVTLICMLFGAGAIWYRSKVAEYERQQRVAERIVKYGGITNWKSSAPTWLPWLSRSRVFQKAVDVQCGLAKNSNDAFAIVEEVAKLPSVETCSVPDKYLDDPRLFNQLVKLKHLRELVIQFGISGFIPNGYSPDEWQKLQDARVQSRLAEAHNRVPTVAVQVFYY